MNISLEKHKNQLKSVVLLYILKSPSSSGLYTAYQVPQGFAKIFFPSCRKRQSVKKENKEWRRRYDE